MTVPLIVDIATREGFEDLLGDRIEADAPPICRSLDHRDSQSVR